MKVLEYFKEHILILAIIMLAIFIIAIFSLELLGFRFLNSVYYLVIPIILVFVVVGMIQMIIKFKSKVIKIIASVLFGGLVVLCVLGRSIIVLILALFYSPENYVEIDGVKYVAYVDKFLVTNVRYYEYVNNIIRKDNIKFKENYGFGLYDPFEENTKAVLESSTYYDDNGVEIDTVTADEEKNNIVNSNENSENDSSMQNIILDEELQKQLEQIWGNNVNFNESLENNMDVGNLVETFIKQNDINEAKRILEENDIENLIKRVN